MRQLKINENRLLEKLAKMSTIGSVNDIGVHRLALSDKDMAARDLLKAWMEGAGLSIEIDQIGNMYGTRKGVNTTSKPVAIGSHLDTVANGGRFDGSLGVLGALEVIETLNDNKVATEHPICLVNFTNEEGARFAPDMMGSMVVAGQKSVAETWKATDLVQPNLVFKEELEKIGYQGDLDPTSFRPKHFLEIHIEQGPILEKQGVEIGVVSEVQGIVWLEFKISGQANHAGTTPMEMRSDAGLVAAKISTHCRDLTKKYADLRATSGLIGYSPNQINVIPGEARITADLRSPNQTSLQNAEDDLVEYANEVAVDEGTSILVETHTRVSPVQFDQKVVETVKNASEALGYTNMDMLSGAGHDAQLMASIVPSGMIFIPSKDGISHSIHEYSSDKHICAGVNVLLNATLELANASF